MAEDTRKQQLLETVHDHHEQKAIVEPMRKVHVALRDRDAVEREIALIMREILIRDTSRPAAPRQLAKLVVAYYDGKNDTEIARALGDEKLSKTVARARVRLKLFRELDFKMPFDRELMVELLDSGKTMKEVSEELNVSPSTLREYRHVIEQQEDTTLDPYLERIKDVMEDRDLSEHMTRGVINDGLSEAIDVAEAIDMGEF